MKFALLVFAGTETHEPPQPLVNALEIATFGVVAFSVLVQGLTMPPLLKKLDLLPKPSV